MLFRDGPWLPANHGYAGEVQMLAEYGCNVLQLNYPGTAGLGRNTLLRARTRADRATADDVRIGLDWLTENHPYSARRVAAVGIGFGGWLALRTAEILPDRFRCVVSLNGFNDLKPLFTPPPQRELPEGRDRNLELSENTLACLNQLNQMAQVTIDEARQDDPNVEPLPTLSTTPGQPGNQLESFDFEQASAGEAGAAAGQEDAYWARQRMHNALRLMAEEIEATPVAPPFGLRQMVFRFLRRGARRHVRAGPFGRPQGTGADLPRDSCPSDQAARLRSEWERLEVEYVRVHHPELVTDYRAGAQATLASARQQDPTDPELLCSTTTTDAQVTPALCWKPRWSAATIDRGCCRSSLRFATTDSRRNYATTLG